MQRIDLLTVIHKSIRLMIYDLGNRIQSADFSNAAARSEMAARARDFIVMLDEHAEHEDKRIFPSLHDYESELTASLDQEHRQLEALEEIVLKAVESLESAETEAEQIVAGGSLNRAFDDLAAKCLSHMRREEQLFIPATWQHLSDEEILQIRANVEKSIPPERYAAWMRWIFPAMNINEMSGMLGAIRTNVPELYDRLAGIAHESIGEDRWLEVKQRVEA